MAGLSNTLNTANQNQVAGGNNATATAYNSVAIGTNSVADQDNTVSVGAPGDPRRITNIAPGINGSDAVNVHQLNEVRNKIDEVRKKAYAGIASVSALAGIPNPIPGKRFTMGIGYGYYEGQNAMAIGLKGIVSARISLTAGVDNADLRSPNYKTGFVIGIPDRIVYV